MYLTIFNRPRTGHRPRMAEVVHEGPAHILWRGTPLDLEYDLLARQAKDYARSGTPYCTVLHRQDNGIERSYGVWWPYQYRRIQESYTRDWPRTVTIHQFPASGPAGSGELSIHWSRQQNRAVILLTRPGVADEQTEYTMDEVFAGALDRWIEERAFPVSYETIEPHQ